MRETRITRVDKAADDLVGNRMSRAAFIGRLAGMGIATPVIATMLTSLGHDASALQATARSASGRSSRPAGASTTPDLAAIEAIVYPEGRESAWWPGENATGINERVSANPYEGPYGPTAAGVLPIDYYEGVDEFGIRNWKFTDFQADKEYRVAFANFSAQWDLAVENTRRCARTADRLGCSLRSFDNNFDADTMIRNADLIVQQEFDFAYFGSFPEAVNLTVARKMEEAGIPVAFLAVNPSEKTESIFMDEPPLLYSNKTGLWIGNYVKDNWDGQIDLAILGALPSSGAFVAQREVGFIQGLRSVLPDVPDSVFQEMDSQGLLEPSQNNAADILTANSDARYVIGSGTNDDAAVGIVRALEAAGLAETSAIAGHAGQASGVEELKKPSSALKVSAFTDVEIWSWAIAIGVLRLMGGETSDTNLVPLELVTAETLSEFPPQVGALESYPVDGLN